MTAIEFSDPSLVLLIGPSGSGKSTFAGRHFRPTEVLSSDFCRALVADHESDQSATDDAFELLHLILNKRMQRGRTTVVDATNVQVSSRAALAAIAQRHGVPLVAIIFALPEAVCQAHNLQRSSRQAPVEVIQQQLATLAASLSNLESEGFGSIFTLRSTEEADMVAVIRNSYS